MIARQEQEMGNYKLAHAQLLASHVELMKERKSVPAGLARQLVLLHSYVLVKSLVKRNDHDGAARLLRRVAANISKFPAHVVPILTSAVVECARAGLKKTSLDLAQRLMAPALRPNIGDAYKRKIETIARKPDPNAVDAPEPGSPCPFCDAPGGAYEMTCEVCRADLPCCVAAGAAAARRVVALPAAASRATPARSKPPWPRRTGRPHAERADVDAPSRERRAQRGDDQMIDDVCLSFAEPPRA